MATLTIELPEQEAQTPSNLRRWEELLADAELAKVEGRIETDRHGHLLWSPVPAAWHGALQAEIGCLLHAFMHDGHGITICPISTADGVKAADVAWASPERLRELGDRSLFPHAPEICVEALSPSNTEAEIKEKMALYFDAGAQEVWLCAVDGAMSFWARGATSASSHSFVCPAFPNRIELR